MCCQGGTIKALLVYNKGQAEPIHSGRQAGMRAIGKRLFSWVIIYVGTLVFLLPCSVGAQEDENNQQEEEDSQSEEDIEVELFFSTPDTVISATRHSMPLSESPSAVTVITKEEIEASGARSLPEVLRLVPNMDVQVINSLSYSIGIRSGTSTNSDNLLLLVDGRDTTLELFGFPSYRMHHFSMDDVERIEVIRGPGSALYGANAYSGVIHVFTRQPGQGPTAHASLRGGQNGLLELDGGASHKFGSFSLAGNIGLVRENLWTNRNANGIRLLRGHLHSKIEISTDMNLWLETGGFDSSGAFFFNLGEINLERVTGVHGRARFEYKDFEIEAIYDRFKFDGDFSLNLYYQEFDLVLAEIPHLSGLNDKVVVLAQQAFTVFHNRFTCGAEFVYNHYYFGLMLDPDQDEKRFGVYAQDEIDLSAMINDLTEAEIPKLLITLGLRFDYNTFSEWELSPRAALVFKPADQHSIRIGYAHAFLKPTFFESSLHVRLDDINDLGFETLDFSNENLRNETIDSIEAGYQADLLESRLQLRLDFAYNWYRNRIDLEVDFDKMDYVNGLPDINGPGIGSINDNDGQQGHVVEMQIVGRPLENFRLFFQAGYRQIFNSTTQAFADSEPVWLFGAGASLSNADGWNASVLGFYTGSHYSYVPSHLTLMSEPQPHWIPAAFLLNARIARKFVVESGKLSIGIEAFNLVGHRYREVGGAKMPGRADYGGERLGRRIVFFLEGEI
jgi:outer membrane receptor protein involved in Fe transport